MNKNNNFLVLVEKAMQEQARAHMRPVIEKELLHYDILFALNNAGLLDRLTFQGGTSLRLCYGAPRFSEDLDFVGGYDFETHHLISMKTCLEHYLGKHYGLEVSVKEPKDLSHESGSRNVEVSKWQIRLLTHPERKDLPKKLIKIEVANIPAYTKEPRQLMHNYDFLPDGYSDTIVMVETLDEIFSDKIIAFVNCQKNIRHRDIWDIYWLKQQAVSIKMEIIKKKIHDYKIDNYAVKIDKMIEQLPGIIYGKEFKDQMSRFLPTDIQERTILNEKFLYFLLQGTHVTLDTLGFEWKAENGEIYFTDSLRDLTQKNFEKIYIMAQGLKDKHGFVIIDGKKSQKLIVSPSEEEKARKLCAESTNKLSLPKGYMIDPSLQTGQWFIKFTG